MKFLAHVPYQYDGNMFFSRGPRSRIGDGVVACNVQIYVSLPFLILVSALRTVHPLVRLVSHLLDSTIATVAEPTTLVD